MALPRRNGGILVEFQPMSPEDMQRTMQFLLNQQAQFAADSATLQARFAELTTKTDRLADGIMGLTGIVGHVVRGLDGLAEGQRRTDEQLRETAQSLKETDARLTAHIGTVESHLNLVVEMFERHLREDHGRRPSS
jgi:hypothetical protein